jgi:hypothetical protein
MVIGTGVDGPQVQLEAIARSTVEDMDRIARIWGVDVVATKGLERQ